MRETNTSDLDRFILMDEMRKITRYSEDQLLRLEREHVIPQRRLIGKRRKGWLRSEIAAWIEARPRVSAVFDKETA